METSDILICITNHNVNNNAILLKRNFTKYFKTIIIDSGSNETPEEFDILLNNVYYTGLFNESIKQTKLRKKKYLFFIASDVIINSEDYEKIYSTISDLNEDIWLWAPSSSGQSHTHCKNLSTNVLRDVPYLEGFCFLSKIDLFNFLYPVDLKLNKYGYGIDILLGYNCIRNKRKRCVVDDRIEIHHTPGTGYDMGQALMMMYRWMINYFGSEVAKYTKYYSTEPGSENLYKFLLL